MKPKRVACAARRKFTSDLGMKILKIALASAKFIDKNIKYNAEKITDLMVKAKKQEADIICFGEAFLQGFDAFCWNFEDDKNIAVETFSEIFELLTEKSKEIGIDLMFGFLEKSGDKLYSSYALIENGSLSQLYRRISKGWKEYSITDEHYVEGNSTACFDYRGKKCTVALCGDLWDFPERFDLGEDILFWPVYISYSPEEWNSGTEKEYAEQAKLVAKHTLLINSICDGDSFGGCFEFIDGEVSSGLPMGSEGILLVNI